MRKVYLLARHAFFFGMLIALLAGCAAKYGVSEYTPGMERAAGLMTQAMKHIDAKQGDPDLLVLTNAPSGQVAGQSALPYVDVAMQVTGRTLGTGSLLPILAEKGAHAWFSLYNRRNGQLAYIVSTKQGFEVQYVNAHPQSILTPKGWNAARKGIIAPNLFRTVGISLAWFANANWNTLKATQLHDHICPGLSAGIAVSEYVLKNYPAKPGDKLVFIGASPFCAMDAYQAIFNATPGKQGSFSMLVGNDVIKEHGFKTKPACIFMRVNAKADTCSGAVLVFDFDKAAALAGLKYADLNPKDGSADPMYYIARVKIAWVLAGLDVQKKMKLVSVVKTFSGNAQLAQYIESGNADPYRFIQ